MSALSDIREKEFHTWTKTEKCIVEVWEMQGLEWMAEAAAAELADKAAELLALRERVAKADRALTHCITFLTNVNTITDDSQIELVKELIDAGRADLADAVSIGGFGSAL